MENPYIPIEGKIEKVITESPTIKTFVIKPAREFGFTTGQFIELTVPGMGEAPFTPSSSPFEAEKFDLTIMNVGRVTERLHQMKAGDQVGIRGPYGKGYPVEKMYGKEVLILGGGVGMAPLRSLLLHLLHEADKFKRIVLCYGSRAPADVIYKDQFTEWMDDKRLEVYRSVDKADESWAETEGVVTVLLDKFKLDMGNCVAVVCGPPIMMKFGTVKLLDLGHQPANMFLSMERNMSCGLGKCGHCMIGEYYACKDGPVFSYDTIQDVFDLWA